MEHLLPRVGISPRFTSKDASAENLGKTQRLNRSFRWVWSANLVSDLPVDFTCYLNDQESPIHKLYAGILHNPTGRYRQFGGR